MEEFKNFDENQNLEDVKKVEEMEAQNIKPLCNYLYNKNLKGNLNQYKDTEIAAMNDGFCLLRGYLPPTQANHVAEKCSVDSQYIGYISSIKAREYKTDDGNIIYRIRIVCHLIIEDEVAEFYTELPSTISPTSKLSTLLITMGVPIFNFPQDSVIDLDYCLKDRNIIATLQKYEKNDKVYYYVNEIRPRTV